MGTQTWSDRLAADEAHPINGLPTTSPARTAFDLAYRYPIVKSVPAIDALARATKQSIAEAEVLTERYKGRRNIRRARQALKLVDSGAESPRESWVRLLPIEAGYPRPRTQIPVYGHFGELVAVLDMGWEEAQIAVEYEGDHHRTDRWQFDRDVRRFEALPELGWITVRTISADTPGGILGRVADAWARQTPNLAAQSA